MHVCVVRSLIWHDLLASFQFVPSCAVCTYALPVTQCMIVAEMLSQGINNASFETSTISVPLGIMQETTKARRRKRRGGQGTPGAQRPKQKNESRLTAQCIARRLG